MTTLHEPMVTGPDLSVWPASTEEPHTGAVTVGGVPVAGAYRLSMASGYTMVGRPPVVAVRDGLARLLIRRESLGDIRSRDVGLQRGVPLNHLRASDGPASPGGAPTPLHANSHFLHGM